MSIYYEGHGVTLHHGDCREVVAGLDDESIGFVFTDPPYGSNQNKGDLNAGLRKRDGTPDAIPIANDTPEEADALVRWLYGTSRRVLVPGGCFACCCHGNGSKKSQQFARWTLWLSAVLDFKAAVVWDKGPMGLGWHYRRSYEFVLVAQKPRAACEWHDTSHRVENIIRPGAHGIKRMAHQKKKHPTEKPRALAELFLQCHTPKGGLVLDPFAGAGSTLAAAVATGRRAIGCELDERWCEAAVGRIEEAAKEKAVRCG